MGNTFCVISHTHWDREWYLPFEKFRIKLVDMIDGLLEILAGEPRYRFHLDAQTVVLEDYLEIRRDREAELRRYIAEGRLLVGPWYLQSDFFLTSGEATVRNLLTGMRIANGFGGCMMVGYTPDQFGLISQLPQILEKTGIGACVFARGYCDGQPDRQEFLWRGEDGSAVLAVYLPHWYNNAQRFSADRTRSLALVEANRRKLADTASSGNLLLMHGVDHLSAQGDLLEILDDLNGMLPPGDCILQDTLPEYIARVRPCAEAGPAYAGEMRRGGRRNLLSGTLSSRVYLKQRNAQCQTLLENQLEPLCSVLSMACGVRYPRDYLNHLWKLLMKNHAHDSICGCSCDAVHRHMVDRFESFLEIGREQHARAGQALAARVAREGLPGRYVAVVANTLPVRRSGVVEMELDFPREESVQAFALIGARGEEAPFDVLWRRDTVLAVYSSANLPGYLEVTRWRIRLMAEDVPAMGFKAWGVVPSGGMRRPPAEAEAEPVLENQWLRAEARPDGTVDLLCKDTGVWHRGLLRLEDRADIGDSYVHDDGGHPPLANAAAVKTSAAVRGPVSQACAVSLSMALPEQYDFTHGRRGDKTVQLPVELRLTLNLCEPFLRVEIEADNQARDHCLRLLLPTDGKTRFHYASAPFDVMRRRAGDGRQPMNGFADVSGEEGGLTAFAEGLYEYEHGEDGTLALTLLRCNGFLHKDDDDGDLGDGYLVPENQCRGRHVFRLALYPHGGTVYEAEAPWMAQRFAVELSAFYQPDDPNRFVAARPFAHEPADQEIFYEGESPDRVLQAEHSLLELDGGVVFSCLKKAENRESYILRVYNPAPEETAFSVGLPPGTAEVWRTDLAERRLERLGIGGGRCCGIAAKPKEIVTLELCPGGSAG